MMIGKRIDQLAKRTGGWCEPEQSEVRSAQEWDAKSITGDSVIIIEWIGWISRSTRVATRVPLVPKQTRGFLFAFNLLSAVKPK